MKKILVILVIAFALYQTVENYPNLLPSQAQQSVAGDQQIVSVIQNKKSNSQVSGSGIVISTLPDDTKGSQHQRFILKLVSGQTLLIAHNIDLAPRINSLHKGDTVAFYGEYEWNSKGGVVHWTHRDPRGSHIGGWLKHKGVTYQ